MPIREYFCKTCGYAWEEIRKLSQEDPVDCLECNTNGTIGRRLAAPALHFKGANWTKPESKPEFNVSVNPLGKTYDEKFKIVEKTPTNTKEAQEVHREATKVNGPLSVKKAPPSTK
jgi:putative FmdB family regulatory protein